MKPDYENKLSVISDVWSRFIWEYGLCRLEIKFNEDVKTNYLGDILGYFHDTFEIIFTPRRKKSFRDEFANNISLLQAIYLQQDFVLELLEIFKCGIDKGALKNNPDYSLNREIRNELVGHPIRKLDGKLISSTTFSYNTDVNTLLYLRYHKDNNFKFELRSFTISEITDRHRKFLNTYFDQIILKLKYVVNTFGKEIEHFEKIIEGQKFDVILKIASIKFESIFKFDHVYNSESLIKIYSRRHEHPRYQNLIDKFYSDLKGNLAETKLQSEELFETRKFIASESIKIKRPTIKIVQSTNNQEQKTIKQKRDFQYELGKLATKRNLSEFDFFSSFLKSHCKNKSVLNELTHMRNNLEDDIEYYCSYRLIHSTLKQD